MRMKIVCDDRTLAEAANEFLALKKAQKVRERTLNDYKKYIDKLLDQNEYLFYNTMQEILPNKEHFPRSFVKKLFSDLTHRQSSVIIDEKGGNANEKTRTL